MKNLVKFLVPAAVAALALVSCNKEDNYTAPADANAVTIRVHASANELKADGQETKTYIDNTNTILWGTGEYMKLALGSGTGTFNKDNTAFGTSKSTSADVWENSDEAEFEFEITPKDATAESFTLMGLYPSSAAVSSNNENPVSYKVALPSTQNATASSYDPAAYLMVAEPETFTSTPGDWIASFRRGTALNKVTLKNLPEDIVSVEFSSSNKDLAGRAYFDLTTGALGSVYEGSESVKVTYATALSGSSIDVWFTSWEVAIASGEKLLVVAKSATKSYSREITANAKGINFKVGYLNTLSINMASATVKTLEDYTGNYLIAYKSPSEWIIMDPTFEIGTNKYYNGLSTSVNEAVADVEYSDFSGVNNIDDYIWIVEEYDGQYSIKSSSTNQYLALTKQTNEAHGATELSADTKYAISIDASSKVATIESASQAGRILRYNSSNPRFAFYTSGQQDIYLIPATIDPRTPVTLSFAEAAINKTTANYSEFTGQTATATPSVSGITYAIDGDAIGTINATSGAVTLNGNTGTATVTASFAGDATYRPASASYTITVASASGPVYTKVTALSDVTAGTYVIVNDGHYLPNAAATSAGPVKNNNTVVTVSGNNLTGVTDEMTWEFSGTASEMTIKSSSDNYYLYVSGSGNSNLRVSTASDHTWTISDYSGTTGAFSLKDNTNDRYCASYNSDWRSYTTYNASNYKDGGRIYLYKLDDSNVTPTVATPTFSFIPSGNKVSISCATDGATIYYTTNGSDPTTSSNVYSEAISLSSNQMTIKAFATKSGYDDSAIASTTYYAINREATTNGSISAVDYAAEGDEVTITVTPDSGYALDQLSVVDGSTNAVAVSNNKFTMPASPVTVSATFALIPVTTIADALGAPGVYEVPNVAVYAVKGNALILGDASGKIYAFKSDHGLSVGDVRTVSGSTKWYNDGDVYEFDAPTFSGSGTTSVNHGTALEFASVAATLKTETGFASPGSGAAHTAVYVHAIGSQSGRNITTSNGEKLYLSANENDTDGKTVEVYGYVYAYSASHSNFNFLVTSIEEDTTTPTLSVSTSALNWAATETDSKSITVTLNGSAAAGDYTYSVTSGNASDWTISKNNGTLSVAPKAANTSTTDPKSITLTIAHANNSSVYQEVTCTQATASNGNTPTSIVLSASTSGMPTAYGSKKAFDDATLEGYAFKIQQIYATGGKLQWRAAGNSNGTGTLYNADAMPAGIASIVIVYNSSDSNKNHTVQIGSSANPSSATTITPTISGSTYTFTGDGTSKYFVITNGSGAGYIDSITINFN